MEIVSFNSSAIAKGGYSGGNLFIKFVGGRWYKYIGVPESLYTQLLNSASKGTFVNRRIKPFYRGVLLTSQELETVSPVVLRK